MVQSYITSKGPQGLRVAIQVEGHKSQKGQRDKESRSEEWKDQ